MGVLVITDEQDPQAMKVYAAEHWGHAWDMWKILQGEGVRGRYYEPGAHLTDASVTWYEKQTMALVTEWVGGKINRAPIGTL